MRGVLTVREHESLEVGPALTRQDVADLEAVAWKVLKRRDGNLAASNHVGIVTTRRGLVVEILPTFLRSTSAGMRTPPTRRHGKLS